MIRRVLHAFACMEEAIRSEAAFIVHVVWIPVFWTCMTDEIKAVNAGDISRVFGLVFEFSKYGSVIL